MDKNLSVQAEAIWKLLCPYIANENADEDYSEQMAEMLCEGVLPNVWNIVLKLDSSLQVLDGYLEEHEINPHAPAVDDAGVATCYCFGCKLARKAFGAGK